MRGSNTSSTQIEWDTDPDTLAGMQDLLDWSVGLRASKDTVVCYIPRSPRSRRLTTKPSPSMLYPLAPWRVQNPTCPTTTSGRQSIMMQRLHSNASPCRRTANASPETPTSVLMLGANALAIPTPPHLLSIVGHERKVGSLANPKHEPLMSARMMGTKLVVKKMTGGKGGRTLS